ncbi:hypothetical protein QG37_02432 [Candidozyma auris]|nr:hypothetical protein QG37_02432 [[Candida] auris]
MRTGKRREKRRWQAQMEPSRHWTMQQRRELAAPCKSSGNKANSEMNSIVRKEGKR